MVLSGTSFLCVLGRLHMRYRCEPVGRIRSYKFAGSKPSLCNCSRRRCIRDSIFEVLFFSLEGQSVRNFASSSRMEFIFLMQSVLFKITTPDPLSGLVIRIFLFDRRDLIALRHFLCMRKSPASTGVPQ